MSNKKEETKKIEIPNGDLARVRNIGIIAHIDAGKTSLTEAMLYNVGATHKLGKVHEGTTEMDTTDQERERGITISGACVTFIHEVDADKVPHLK